MSDRADERAAPISEVEVICYKAFDGWNCSVSVTSEDRTRTEHGVSVRREELQRYSLNGDVHGLVEASFRFLLEREPKESILRQFKLSDIERYFPEFRGVIMGRLRT